MRGKENQRLQQNKSKALQERGFRMMDGRKEEGNLLNLLHLPKVIKKKKEGIGV